jgi:hypothetical protein
MALAHGYALPFVTQKVVGDYASDNAAATARAIASGATKEAAGSCLDARAINLQMRVPQRTDTNLLTNSAMAGATGSVLPTKWVSGSVNGLTVTISSAFTSAGFQAIDWTVSGTADSDGTIYIGCEPNDNTNAIPASIGQQYIGAMSLGKQAGTIPATMVMQVLGQKSSDGSVIETANSTTDLNGLVSGSLTRVNTAVLSIASVSSDRVNFRLTADVLQNDVISFTIRIAAPQVERNDRISPYITTTTGAASRVTGQPSLLVVPQLTRAGFLYPQLPTVSGADFTFTRNTTATRVNASGLIESVASGILRLDYPIGGGCPAALIEASGTNLVLQSRDLSVSGNWTASGVTAVKNAVGADGTASGATTLTATAASGTITQALSHASQSRIFSAFIRRVSGSGAIQLTTNGGTNWDTVTVTTAYTQLASVARTVASGTVGIRMIASGDVIEVDYTQGEVGPVATSPIPTTTASATRNADVCSVSGVSGYIGQTEGTLYVEWDISRLNAGNFGFNIDNGSVTEYVSIARLSSTGAFRLAIKKSSGSEVNLITSSAFSTGIFKVACGYKNGDYTLYVNGAQIGTSNNSTDFPTGTLSRCIISDANFGFPNNRLRSAAIYTTRLTNDQLANITRLT